MLFWINILNLCNSNQNFINFLSFKSKWATRCLYFNVFLIVSTPWKRRACKRCGLVVIKNHLLYPLDPAYGCFMLTRWGFKAVKGWFHSFFLTKSIEHPRLKQRYIVVFIQCSVYLFQAVKGSFEL